MTRTFWTRLFTGDESWCFAYNPKTKYQSSEWVGKHSPWPKKLRFQKSKVKTMLIVYLFHSQGIVHRELVQEGCTVNAEYYKGVLDRLISRIRLVRPALYSTRDFFLLHDSAPAHSATKIRQFLTQKQVATLNHPHTCHICLSRTTSCSRRWCGSWRVQAVTDQLNKIPPENFSNAMKKLETRANLCIASNGYYFE